MNSDKTLQVTTPGDREIVMTRTFDAPRALVWEAMSKPDLLKRWLLGPPGWTMVECENDVRAGGKSRFVWRSSDGRDLAMHGAYREVTPPERAVRTESMLIGRDPETPAVVTTLVLSERDGRTHLTLTVTCPSKEVRDGMIAAGMERGIIASYQRLDEVLGSMPSQRA
jgi:uncharacterized protein YndB with AHSA1/START domain